MPWQVSSREAVRLSISTCASGCLWQTCAWTAVPDTDPQMYQWVRINTDEQAAAWVAKIDGQRPSKFNQPKEPE